MVDTRTKSEKDFDKKYNNLKSSCDIKKIAFNNDKEAIIFCENYDLFTE